MSGVGFFFLWELLFELCPWSLDCQQNVTIKSIAWYCAAGYRVRYFEICWRNLSCFCRFLYNYRSLPGINDKMDANIKPGVLVAFRENFQKWVKISAPAVCSRAAVHLWLCTVKRSFWLVKMDRQLLLWNMLNMLKHININSYALVYEYAKVNWQGFYSKPWCLFFAFKASYGGSKSRGLHYTWCI